MYCNVGSGHCIHVSQAKDYTHEFYIPLGTMLSLTWLLHESHWNDWQCPSKQNWLDWLYAHVHVPCNWICFATGLQGLDTADVEHCTYRRIFSILQCSDRGSLDKVCVISDTSRHGRKHSLTYTLHISFFGKRHLISTRAEIACWNLLWKKNSNSLHRTRKTNEVTL